MITAKPYPRKAFNDGDAVVVLARATPPAAAPPAASADA